MASKLTRILSLVWDRDAAKRVQEEAEDALAKTGTAAAAEFEEAMSAGGKRAARALTNSLKKEFDSTMARARVEFARGVIDEAQFARVGRDAAQKFNAGLLSGMDRLQREGKVTELQYASLASRLKQVGEAGESGATRTGRAWTAAGGLIQRALGPLLAFFGVYQAGTFLLSTNRLFESLLAQLKVLEGSEDGALRVFTAIEEFARKTPFSIEQLTEAYIRLRTSGIEPTEAMLTAFGDLASARGKSIQDFAMAVEDAVTGEMERLKEFGIKASQIGGQVSFTFNGVTTSVRNTKDAIVEYLEQVGNSEIVQGTMAGQMVTLNGQISNLWDNLGTLARTIGEQGGVNEQIGGLASEVSGLTEDVNENADAVASWTKLVVGVGGTLLHSVLFPIRFIWNAITALGIGLAGAYKGAEAALTRLAERMVSFEADVRDFLGQDEEAARLRARAAELDRASDEAMASARRFADSVSDDLDDIENAASNVGRSLGDAINAIRELTSSGQRIRAIRPGAFGGGSPVPTPATAPDGSGAGVPSRPRSTMPSRGLTSSVVEPGAGWGGSFGGPVPVPGEEPLSEWQKFFGEIQQNAGFTAFRMTDAFSEFFTSLATGFSAGRDGFHSMADAAKGVGAAMISSLAEGWAGYSMARGTAALAEGTWPPNPAAIFSSLKWFSAAGMFRALGGALAGAGQSRDVAGGRDPGLGVAERAQPAENPIILQINPWDPKNPLMQRSVYGAMQYARERYGENTRIVIS